MSVEMSVPSAATDSSLVQWWAETTREWGGPLLGSWLALALPALALIALVPVMAVLMLSLQSLEVAIVGRIRGNRVKRAPEKAAGDYGDSIEDRERSIVRERGTR